MHTKHLRHTNHVLRRLSGGDYVSTLTMEGEECRLSGAESDLFSVFLLSSRTHSSVSFQNTFFFGLIQDLLDD